MAVPSPGPSPAAESDPLRVAVAGFGAIGFEVARAIDAGAVPGLALAAVAARDLERARARCAKFRSTPVVRPATELAALADVVVECAPAAAFAEIARPALEAGRILVCVSVGALLDHFDCVDLAARRGGRILVPSGALLGLDAVQAAARGEVEEVRMVTRKPPAGLAGVPWLVERGIDVHALGEPTRVFEGTAREGARRFPANVNVAAALGLAGVGPDRTRLEIWVDPTVTRNTHDITVEAQAARFTLHIENVPSEANPRTGRLVAPSVLATLAKLTSPLVVGT
ncbi:MAG: aspartate dehydrogenase [Immundisolibacterales bacterium]|nr:aspartate dehydrogenase [Immundisolibacterales bacterium]